MGALVWCRALPVVSFVVGPVGALERVAPCLLRSLAVRKTSDAARDERSCTQPVGVPADPVRVPRPTQPLFSRSSIVMFGHWARNAFAVVGSSMR